MKKRAIVWFGLLAVAAIMVSVAARKSYAAATLKSERTPVTIFYENKIGDAAAFDSIAAYRKDGSAAHVFADGPGSGLTHRVVEDVSTRSTTAIDLIARTRTTVPRSDNEIKRATTWHNNCEAQFQVPPPGGSVICEDVPERRFNQRIMRVTISIVQKDGSVPKRVLLVAPDLEFLVLEEQHYIGEQPTQARKAKSLVIGEPDASLFATPMEFAAKSYSDFREKELTARGLPVNPKAKEQWHNKEAILGK